MTYAPAFDWTGSHIGLSGGYAFDGHDASYTYNGVAPEEVAILPSGASLSSNGGIIGGNIGYDAQFNGVVVGVEADLSWTNFGDDTTHVFPGEPGTRQTTNHIRHQLPDGLVLDGARSHRPPVWRPVDLRHRRPRLRQRIDEHHGYCR